MPRCCSRIIDVCSGSNNPVIRLLISISASEYHQARIVAILRFRRVVTNRRERRLSAAEGHAIQTVITRANLSPRFLSVRFPLSSILRRSLIRIFPSPGVIVHAVILPMLVIVSPVCIAISPIFVVVSSIVVIVAISSNGGVNDRSVIAFTYGTNNIR